MRKVVLYSLLALDGVAEDPGEASGSVMPTRDSSPTSSG